MVEKNGDHPIRAAGAAATTREVTQMPRTHYHVVIDYMPEPAQIGSKVAAAKACSEQVRAYRELDERERRPNFRRAWHLEEGRWNGRERSTGLLDTIVEYAPCDEVHD
jgi:hypothetical protein